jgi:hypothetical protein
VVFQKRERRFGQLSEQIQTNKWIKYSFF